MRKLWRGAHASLSMLGCKEVDADRQRWRRGDKVGFANTLYNLYEYIISTYNCFPHSMMWKPRTPLHPSYLMPKSVRIQIWLTKLTRARSDRTALQHANEHTTTPPPLSSPQNHSLTRSICDTLSTLYNLYEYIISPYNCFSHSMMWKPRTPLHPSYPTPKSVRIQIWLTKLTRARSDRTTLQHANEHTTTPPFVATKPLFDQVYLRHALYSALLLDDWAQGRVPQG